TSCIPLDDQSLLSQTTTQATSTNANHRPPSRSHHTCRRLKQPKPGQRPLHLPATPPEPHSGVDPTPGHPWPDPAAAEIGAIGRAVVRLVAVDLVGSPTPPTGWGRHGRDIIQERLEHDGVARVGGGDHRRQRQAARVAAKVELAPRLATIDWIAPPWSPAFGAHAHGVPPGLRPVQPACSPSRSDTSRWS